MRRRHHDLRLWQESLSLAKVIYQFAKTLPHDELYVLSAQMRRAALSIPCNVAEGAARTSRKEFLQFLSFARGSLSELETQVILAKELGYINDPLPVMERIGHVFGLLGGLMKSLKEKGNE